MNITRQFQVLIFILMTLATGVVQAFVVKDIQVRGLQRISAGTVFNYLPVNIGDEFTPQKAAKAIRALFKTGFFKDIALEQSGNVLIVHVKERPSIAKIIIEGNKDIKKDDLEKALNTIGLSEGKVFNRQLLEKVEQELTRQYFSHGKYGVRIKTEVSQLTRNRVGIHIEISEGRVAKIKQINLVGNKVFDSDQLLDLFELSTTNWLSFYTKDDQYSKQKLSADLERLRSYYLDRGYIKFDIESTQVTLTPDKKEIYITVNLKEGDLYTLEKVRLTGNLVVQPQELIKLVEVGPGEIFSRKNATLTSKAISDRLGDEGYLFANVNMVPEIDEKNKTVVMTFFVDPGKRVYVRRINMKGNSKTRDEVLRREMRQMEAAWASTRKIDRSKTRLERLGYFEQVNVETPPVVGASDQVDIDYSVTERSSGNLSAGIGFSQVQGLVFNANISQNNVFGTGKRVDLAFNNSSVTTQYRFGYFDPYYTLDGVSMGYDLGYVKRNANNANISNYTTDVINTGFNFGIPLNEFDRLRFNFDAKYTKLKTGLFASREIQDFINLQGDSFLTVSGAAGWTHDTLNRALFPTSGGQQRFSALATIPGSDLTYYKVSYKQQQYFPIARDLTFRLLGEVAYGNGYGDTKRLPFFEHYFAGGVRSIRGFKANTLGPRDSNNRAFGGASKITGKAELFFPVPFMKESKSVRMGAFVDAGTVNKDFSLSNMRYSVGISGEWLSPFGALSVSFAIPMNSGGNDQTQSFQFSFGSGF